MADTKPEAEAMTPELDAYYWARYERAAVGGEKRLAKAEAALRAALSPKPVEVAPDDEALIDAFFDEAKHKGDYGPARLALRRRIAELRELNRMGFHEKHAALWCRARDAESALSSMEDDRNVWKASAERAHAALAACRDKTIEECEELMGRQWPWITKVAALALLRDLKNKAT